MSWHKVSARAGLALLPVAFPTFTLAQQPEPKSEHAAPAHDPAAAPAEYDPSAFRPDPAYGSTWDPAQQEDIYGGKVPVRTQRPLLELGRELYREGPLQPGRSWLFGDENRLYPHLMVYGDWRFAGGLNDLGDEDFGQLATRLNLDVDVQLTATERIHAFLQPFERNGEISRLEFGERDDEELALDGNLDALFFEGDVGSLTRGTHGTVSDFDMPFAVGLMPLLFQNGVWVEDAFTGLALTLPARNSPTLGISNYDATFFAGIDKIDSGAVSAAGGDDSDASIVGLTSFLEVLEGYWELGYGYTFGRGAAKDADYNNLTAAFTRRYGGWLSNSVRALFNFGQDSNPETASGGLLLVENSLITSDPYGCVPYFNLFAGHDHPQSLARAAGAGGVLKNTGINFEADALTAFPALDATGHDSYGAALGLELLMGFDAPDPALRSQLVFELAGQHPYGDDAAAAGDELALGLRYQKPLSHRFIFRADATAGAREEADEYAALRLEFRWKF